MNIENSNHQQEYLQKDKNEASKKEQEQRLNRLYKQAEALMNSFIKSSKKIFRCKEI